MSDKERLENYRKIESQEFPLDVDFSDCNDAWEVSEAARKLIYSITGYGNRGTYIADIIWGACHASMQRPEDEYSNRLTSGCGVDLSCVEVTNEYIKSRGEK